MNLFNRSAAAARPDPAQDPLVKGAALVVVSTPPEPAPSAEAAAPTAARDAMFEKLSRMFRRAGTDVAAQALFRVVMEYRVEGLEKQP